MNRIRKHGFFLLPKCISVLLLMIMVLPYSFVDAMESEKRQFIILIDNSGSMFGVHGKDARRYSIQASKIINDLLSYPKDSISLLRLTNYDNCDGYNGSILVTGGGDAYKSKFDQHVMSSAGGDNFSSPIATAKVLFEKSNADKKLLLIITDLQEKWIRGKTSTLSGCNKEEHLQAMKKNNVDLTVINLSKNGAKSLFSEWEKIDNSKDLIGAIARIYQRFIGGKNAQSGDVIGNSITVDIDNYVKYAYIIIAADGVVGSINSSKSNPSSISIDKNHKGGGVTQGWDGVNRSYKIIKIEHPSAGNWKFEMPELTSRAGWMLIQDYSVNVKIDYPKVISQNYPTVIKAKLYDDLTGKPLKIEKDVTLTLKDENGKVVKFNNDDDEFTATILSKKARQLTYVAILEGKNIHKKKEISIQVLKGSWIIEPQLPKAITIGQKTELKVKLKKSGETIDKPEKIVASLKNGKQLEMKHVGGLTYKVTWIPTEIGENAMTFSGEGKSKVVGAKAIVNVLGDAKFGKAVPIDFGITGSKTSVERTFDLSDTKIYGSLPIKINFDYSKLNSYIEIEKKGKWIDLRRVGEIDLIEGGLNKWKVRLVVQGCPESVLPNEKFIIRAWYKRLDGSIEEIKVPLKIQIERDAWLVCWWPFIVGAIFTTLLLWIIHCIRSPARFPSTFELLLSPESDLREEGVKHKVLNYKGSKIGFCRDARIYMHQDMRFTSSAKGAYIKFQARKSGVYIIVLGNGALWYKRFGMDWEKEPMSEEVPLRTGVTYRNDNESLFFEAKNI